MKKLILGLGTTLAVVAPIAAVVACGDEGHHKPTHQFHLKSTKNAAAIKAAATTKPSDVAALLLVFGLDGKITQDDLNKMGPNKDHPTTADKVSDISYDAAKGVLFFNIHRDSHGLKETIPVVITITPTTTP